MSRSQHPHASAPSFADKPLPDGAPALERSVYAAVGMSGKTLGDLHGERLQDRAAEARPRLVELGLLLADSTANLVRLAPAGLVLALRRSWVSLGCSYYRPLSAQARAPSRPSGGAKEQEPVKNRSANREGNAGRGP